MLTSSELRRWCRLHTKRGKAKHLTDRSREFATNAFIRLLDWQPKEFYEWLAERKSMPARVQNTMSKFIADWEAGLVEFTPYRSKTHRVLVRREKPGGRRRRFAVVLGAAPRITLRESPAPEPLMPTFRELIRTRI